MSVHLKLVHVTFIGIEYFIRELVDLVCLQVHFNRKVLWTNSLKCCHLRLNELFDISNVKHICNRSSQMVSKLSGKRLEKSSTFIGSWWSSNFSYNVGGNRITTSSWITINSKCIGMCVFLKIFDLVKRIRANSSHTELGKIH